MNKFETMLNDAKYFSKLLGHFCLAALEVNKTQEETKQDFINSKRTGQCALSIHYDLVRIGAHHVRTIDDTEVKFRYSVAGNNKINFLLENPGRNNTFPQNEEEVKQFPLWKIFGGGIRTTQDYLELIAISGFHPRVDEAGSIVVKSEMMGLLSDKEKTANLMRIAKRFNNPYALAISAGAHFIKSMNFDQAIEWGKNEIITQNNF